MASSTSFEATTASGVAEVDVPRRYHLADCSAYRRPRIGWSHGLTVHWQGCPCSSKVLKEYTTLSKILKSKRGRPCALCAGLLRKFSEGLLNFWEVVSVGRSVGNCFPNRLSSAATFALFCEIDFVLLLASHHVQHGFRLQMYR